MKFKYHIQDTGNSFRSCWVKTPKENDILALSMGRRELRVQDVSIVCKKEFNLL